MMVPTYWCVPGIDLNESQRENTVRHLKDYLKQSGYSDPAVEVWSQDTLIGFLEFFPSLALQLNGYEGTHFPDPR